MRIVITDLIKDQAVQCLVMASAGIVFSTFYQLCSFFSKRATVKKWIRAGLELFFWVIAAVMTSQFLYYCAYGSLSFHAAAAFAAGALLWKRLFCDIMASSQSKGQRTRGLKKKHGKEKKKQSV